MMRRILAASVCVLALSAAAPQAEPVPVACAVVEEQPRCEAVAQIGGNVTYLVNGSAKFAIYRGGVRRRCVIVGGHEAGNLWVGDVRAGDVLRIDFRAGYPSAGMAGGTLPMGTAGFGDQSVC